MRTIANIAVSCMLLALFVSAESGTLCAQTNNVGIGTVSPDASALLDLTSISRGLLVPRLTSPQRTGITTPATSLLVYDLTLSQFYYWTGVIWAPFSASSVGWNITGNAGTVATTNFLGTTDAVDLHLRTNNVEHIAITTAGFVGIDTMTPARPLDIVRDAPSGSGTGLFRTSASGYGVEIGGVGANSTYGAVRAVNSSGANADMFLQSTNPGGTNGNVSINNTAPNTKVDVSGDLAIRRYDTTVASGLNNDFDIRGYSFVRISSATAAFTITGISGGVDGKILIFYNATTFNMTLANASGSSAGANQILTMTGANSTTVGTGAFELIYSGSDAKWLVMSFQP
jgi:hypothetical protein